MSKVKLEDGRVSSQNTLGTLVLLSDMLSYMPPSALISSPEFSTTPTVYVNAHQRAAAAYGLEGTFTTRQGENSLAPLTTAAEDLLTILNLFSTNMIQPYASSNDEIFAIAAKLLGSLIVKSQEKQTTSLKVDWDVHKWLEDVLSFLDEVRIQDINLSLCLPSLCTLRQSPSLWWTALSRYLFPSTRQIYSNQILI